jgi:hypothetical protein
MATKGTLATNAVRPSFRNDQVVEVVIDWTSDASGNASYLIPEIVAGALWKAFAVPASGDDAPSDNYDVALKEVVLGANGDPWVVDSDITSGGLGNLDVDQAIDPKPFWPTTVVTVCTWLQVEISNAGDTNSGRLILYFYRKP